MPHYHYLLVGGGMTAAAAMSGIREVDQEGSIGMIGADPEPPYNRPPLSKGLWKGDSIDDIWRKMPDDNVELHLGRTVTSLDVPGKRATDDEGTEFTFEKLLLATGGTPRRLPFGGDEIIYFRTLADYRRLREISGPGRRVAVIGGGFIGSEVAAALAISGAEVVMVFPESGIGSRLYPADLVTFVTDFYREKGVTVLSQRRVTGMDSSGAQKLLQISDRDGAHTETIAVDGVVAGLGIQPNVELAQQAGLTIDDGIVVDELLSTGNPDMYAAGDVAAFVNPALDRRLRVEHEDNANKMGKQAGRNMAGAAEPYHHLPSFYSDLFDLGYEAVGEVDARLETVADWTEPHHKGVIYYLRDGRVRGVLLWNVWKQVRASRRLIAASELVQPDDLIGRLPAKR